MDEIIIICIILQAIFNAVCMFTISRQLHDFEEQVKHLGSIAALIPIFLGAMIWIINGRQIEAISTYLEFVITSIVVNEISAVPVVMFEKMVSALSGGRR